jgi:hypothetical protein
LTAFESRFTNTCFRSVRSASTARGIDATVISTSRVPINGRTSAIASLTTFWTLTLRFESDCCPSLEKARRPSIRSPIDRALSLTSCRYR